MKTRLGKEFKDEKHEQNPIPWPAAAHGQVCFLAADPLGPFVCVERTGVPWHFLSFMAPGCGIIADKVDDAIPLLSPGIL